MPLRNKYIEPFGGTGAVLLARRKSRIEVLNDRFLGIVAFYRCLRDKDKFDALCDRLRYTVHAREEFLYCRDTWYEDQLDDIERAARWYYAVKYSFSGLSRNFARATNSGRIAGSIQNCIPEFFPVHQRLQNVQIENLDWKTCIDDYDSEDAVFYIDPPYMDTDISVYKQRMSKHYSHKMLLDRISNMKGFVAISGFENELYDSYGWDERIKFPKRSTMNAMAYTESNNRKGNEHCNERGDVTECLWLYNAK